MIRRGLYCMSLPAAWQSICSATCQGRCPLRRVHDHVETLYGHVPSSAKVTEPSPTLLMHRWWSL